MKTVSQCLYLLKQIKFWSALSHCESHSVMSNSLWFHGIIQARILEWVAFLCSRGIFPTQESNPGLPHYRQILYRLSYQGICLQYKRAWFDCWVGKIPWRRDRLPTPVFFLFPCGSAGKVSACNVGDLGSVPGLGRSPEEGNGNHSHFLAWRIPWTVQSMGSQSVRHDWVTFTFTFLSHCTSQLFIYRYIMWKYEIQSIFLKYTFPIKISFYLKIIYEILIIMFWLLTFCLKGHIICISDVIDISPGDLDSSVCFIQPSILHDVLCIEVK